MTGKVHYHFLDDRPTAEDKVGTHSTVANTVWDIIHSNLRRPFVIGLFGRWGVGKSSIVKMLAEKVRAENRETRIIVVDAWRKDRATFLRQFIKRLARELLGEEEAKEVCRETDTKKVTNENKWVPDPVARKWFTVFVVLVVLLSLLLLLNYYFGTDKEFPADKLATIMVTLLVAGYFQYILPKYSMKVDCKEEDVTLHDVDHFRNIYLQKILGKCKEKTVCIVIDNLDRIESGDAFGIIRAIKTFIVDAEETSHKVVFVVPCDDAALRKGIKTSVGQQEGGEFLRKFFNVAIRIPDLIDRDAYRYATNLLDETKLELTNIQKDRMAHIIKCLFGNNPRQPKIFINNFLARYMLGESLEQLGRIPAGVITGHPDLFAVYVALDTEFSALPMPKTAGELKEIPKGNYERFLFLQKVSPLLQEITAVMWASYHYLKKANDALLIRGFEDLEEAAMRGGDDFPGKLVEVEKQHPGVLVVLWNSASGNEAQLRMMRSILSAKKKISDLDVRGRLGDEMADVIERNFGGLYDLPAEIVYQDVLMERPQTLLRILAVIPRGDDAAGIKEPFAMGGAKHFQVNLVKAILGDADLPSTLEKPLSAALDFLAARCDELTISALGAEKGASLPMLEKAITLFKTCDPELRASDLVDYCGRFSASQYKKYFDQVVQTLASTLASGKYGTKDLCDGARAINTLISRDNITDMDPIPVINGLGGRYARERDWESKAEILKLLREYGESASLRRWQNQAKQLLLERGKDFLNSSDEEFLRKFLKGERGLVSLYFGGELPNVAGRSEMLCRTVLDSYAEKVREVVRAVGNNRLNWVRQWVEKKPKRAGEMAESIQAGVLDVLLGTNYQEEGYNILGLLDVSRLDQARGSRENHFTALLNTKQPLTAPENVYFLLRRMQLAKYAPTKEQSDAIDAVIGKMDQETLTDEVKDLIKRYQGVKKKGAWLA